MASIIHSFSVKERDLDSEKRIEKLAQYASLRGVSLSTIYLEAFKLFDTTILGELWEPRRKRTIK